jgi:hypothetical protein
LEDVPVQFRLNKCLQHNDAPPHFSVQVTTTISAMEIVALIMEVFMSGDPIHQKLQT